MAPRYVVCGDHDIDLLLQLASMDACPNLTPSIVLIMLRVLRFRDAFFFLLQLHDEIVIIYT